MTKKRPLQCCYVWSGQNKKENKARKWDRIIERQIEREQQERGLSDTDYSGLEYLECEESNHGAVPGILP
jgi:hypothetical protein